MFREKFFVSSSDPEFEKREKQNFYVMYGAGIIKHYRKEKPTDPVFDKVPTFREFVEYLVAVPVSKFDVHWRPVYIQCMPCQIKYNILARVDTIKEDSDQILASLGVNARLSVSHATNNTTYKHVSSYYSQLTRDLIRKLYQIYKFDFLMFGYSYSEYLEFISH